MNSNSSSILSVISKIHADTSSYLRSLMNEQGLPDFASSHGNILFQLSIQKKMTMSELARTIHRDKSTTTVLVKKLEKMGYIEKQQSPQDNRVTFISLSSKGQEYTVATSKISELLITRCYKGFSQKDIEKAFSLLVRISDNFSPDTENK